MKALGLFLWKPLVSESECGASLALDRFERNGQICFGEKPGVGAKSAH